MWYKPCMRRRRRKRRLRRVHQPPDDEPPEEAFALVLLECESDANPAAALPVRRTEIFSPAGSRLMVNFSMAVGADADGYTEIAGGLLHVRSVDENRQTLPTAKPISGPMVEDQILLQGGSYVMTESVVGRQIALVLLLPRNMSLSLVEGRKPRWKQLGDRLAVYWRPVVTPPHEHDVTWRMYATPEGSQSAVTLDKGDREEDYWPVG